MTMMSAQSSGSDCTGSPNVTELLRRAGRGDAAAREEFFQVVHKEVERIARGTRRREAGSNSMDTMDLMNEAAVRLIRGNLLERSPDRRYFFSAVTRAIRQLLIERARYRKAQKRASNRVPLDDVLDDLTIEQRVDVVALGDALEHLRMLDARKYDVVHLRFFGGFTYAEIAQMLDVSVATVERDWRFSQAWLRANMS